MLKVLEKRSSENVVHHSSDNVTESPRRRRTTPIRSSSSAIIKMLSGSPVLRVVQESRVQCSLLNKVMIVFNRLSGSDFHTEIYIRGFGPWNENVRVSGDGGGAAVVTLKNAVIMRGRGEKSGFCSFTDGRLFRGPISPVITLSLMMMALLSVVYLLGIFPLRHRQWCSGQKDA